MPPGAKALKFNLGSILVFFPAHFPVWFFLPAANSPFFFSLGLLGTMASSTLSSTRKAVATSLVAQLRSEIDRIGAAPEASPPSSKMVSAWVGRLPLVSQHYFCATGDKETDYHLADAYAQLTPKARQLLLQLLEFTDADLAQVEQDVPWLMAQIFLDHQVLFAQPSATILAFTELPAVTQLLTRLVTPSAFEAIDKAIGDEAVYAKVVALVAKADPDMVVPAFANCCYSGAMQCALQRCDTFHSHLGSARVLKGQQVRTDIAAERDAKKPKLQPAPTPTPTVKPATAPEPAALRLKPMDPKHRNKGPGVPAPLLEFDARGGLKYTPFSG